MRILGAWVADALFPRFCVLCEAEGDVLCRACKAKWRPAPPIVDGEQFAFFSYADPVVRKLLQAWKYGYDERAWHVLRSEMGERMPQFHTWLAGRGATLFVPVPLFYVKRNERGFDQAIEIAHWCSAMTTIPVKKLVVRAASVKPQAQKTKEERLQSYVRNPFLVSSKAARMGARVLLVDDVYTTGATMRAAEHALTNAGYEAAGHVALLLGGN